MTKTELPPSYPCKNCEHYIGFYEGKWYHLSPLGVGYITLIHDCLHSEMTENNMVKICGCRNPEPREQGLHIVDSCFTKDNADKWMGYEDDIVKYYYPKVLEWLDSEPRKHSQIAFTAGLGRNIARLIETAENKMKEPALITPERLLEKLAELEHQQWMGWSKTIAATQLSEGVWMHNNPTLLRWRQMWVPYNQLPEKVKEADRKWAKKVLAILKDGGKAK